MDWFWLKDGQRLIVTMETASATQQGPAPGGPGAGPEPEPVIQLWLVGAATGESRLLREVKGLDAMFPVAWNGAESVVCLDLPAAQGQPTKLTVTDFSGGKASSRSVADLQGTLRSHAATPDGRLISIHLGTRDGGEIRRINTADGSTKDLITGLPVWDGLYPVWFSPDGRSAAMPDPRNGGRPWRLRLLSIVTGELKHVDPYLDLIDFVRWSPDGRHLAFKVADGSHKLIDVADFSSVLSPKVRVLDETGKVVREFDMAKGHFIGDIEWLDENTLVLGERKSAQEDGPAWVAGLQSTGDGLKPAAPAQAAILKDRPDTYPMPKRGSSSKFKVTVRSWQDQGKAPSEELIITPVG
ncbi:MAG: hypothetical protein HPY55_01940 [Firmicutes bacterium]|nr:hypothetical protein [Bacillota bacterium]